MIQCERLAATLTRNCRSEGMDHGAWNTELAESEGVILFDGNCAFCRNVVGLMLRRLPDADLRVCSTLSSRGEAAARALGGDPADTFAFITDSAVYLGTDAYVRILTLSPGSLSRLGHCIEALPSAIRNGAYGWVANHRSLMSKLMGRGSHDAIPLDRFVVGGM